MSHLSSRVSTTQGGKWYLDILCWASALTSVRWNRAPLNLDDTLTKYFIVPITTVGAAKRPTKAAKETILDG
ncbi:hypothetical protein E4U21_005348 [Claviceps maximensis]|nr:hypothetical protein E4U21_005348 [Claviceps maximensis]